MSSPSPGSEMTEPASVRWLIEENRSQGVLVDRRTLDGDEELVGKAW
jgi:hypothetical protein